MDIVLWCANTTGDAKNCFYPNKVDCHDADELKKAVQRDHVCAEFQNHRRGNNNFVRSTVIVMDCDNDHSDDPNDWISPGSMSDEFTEVAFALVPSRHHMLEKDGKSARPRFHVYFSIPEQTDPARYADLKKMIHSTYPSFDGNALDASRFIYGNEANEVMWNDGKLTIDRFLQQGSSQRVITQGSRNSTMSRFAGRVVKRYGFNETSHQIFLEEAERCDPPLDESELNSIWQSAGRFAKTVSKQPGYIPPNQYNDAMPSGPVGSLKPSDYTDVGQAKVLASEYGDELRYNPATDYMRYDGVCWRESKEAAVGAAVEFTDLQLADATLMKFKAANALMNTGMTPEECKKAVKKSSNASMNDDQLKLYQEYLAAKAYETFVLQRRNWKYIKAAMDTCRSMVMIDLTKLNRDPFLLNTPNATYDLRLGLAGKKDHDPEDYITKVTAIDPGDQGEDLWLDTLDKTFLSDQELIDYVQQVVGLAAIGKVYQEALIIAYGGGRNGKSTFWNTVSQVFGSYAGRLSADTLTMGCRRNVKPELAQTFSKRMIIAAELEEGTRLNTAVVKHLCSTDEVFAEKKYKDPFSFVPTHSVILYTNHLPKISALDDGTWRRLIVIPFNAIFKKDNDKKNFASVLYEKAAPAIMKWIIEGAQKVIANHCKPAIPDCVKQAIEFYREQNDWFHQFLDDCCEVETSAKEKSGELYTQYRNYCMRVGEYVRSTNEFYTVLEQAGFIRRRTKNGVLVSGLRLKSEFDI